MSSKSSLAVGIDLGTTNCAIASLDEHGKPVVIENRYGESVTPSVICFQPNEVSIGSPAKELQVMDSYPVAAFFKRQMGDRHFIFHANEVDYSATDLSKLLLQSVVSDAEAKLGRPIQDVVITVPAYFKEPERQATLIAGKEAGLNVLQVINEPTAAAIAYGLNKFNTKQTILVYDLGGGTFDVTLLNLDNGKIQVINSDGDHQLGGKDWDDRIIAYVVDQFEQEYGGDPLEDAETIIDLYAQAEEVKKRLSTVESTQMSITCDGEKGRYTIDRATFELISQDLMARTVSLTTKVLEDASMCATDLDGVLLVGGSTRMPMVKQYIEQEIKVPILHGVNVDEAVAQGAALIAAERLAEPKQTFGLAGRRSKITDVTNHSLGMIAVNADQSAYLNSIILPKNDPVPCEKMRPFQYQTRVQGHNELEIFMTQGESESPNSVAYLGRYLVQNIPHAVQGQAVIDITYQYDQSGTVKVLARDRHSDQPLTVKVEALPSDVPERFLLPPQSQQQAEPMTAYLAFDLSGSMSGEPLEQAKKAAHSFVENTDLTSCALGIIGFSDNVKTYLKATQNAKKIEQAIEQLKEGDTGYCNGDHPFNELKAHLEACQGHKFAIVLTDGIWSSPSVAEQSAQVCHAIGIDVVAIGFGSAKKDFLAQIASTDESSFYTSQDQLVSTFSTIAQVLTESKSGLSLKGAKREGRLSKLIG